jgi:hypothetical protein
VTQPITVSGWLRRGVTPWVDVDSLRSLGRRVLRSYHPVWSLAAAAIAAGAGILIILNG